MRGCIRAKEADRPPLKSPGARRPQKKNGGLAGSYASLVLSSQPLPGTHFLYVGFYPFKSKDATLLRGWLPPYPAPGHLER